MPWHSRHLCPVRPWSSGILRHVQLDPASFCGCFWYWQLADCSVVQPIAFDLQSRSSYGFVWTPHVLMNLSGSFWSSSTLAGFSLFTLHHYIGDLLQLAPGFHLPLVGCWRTDYFCWLDWGSPEAFARLLPALLFGPSGGVHPWVGTGYQFGLQGPQLCLILLKSPVWYLHLLWAASSAQTSPTVLSR